MAYENKDYTHLSESEKQRIDLIAQAIRNKVYGVDVRESIALAIEWVNREYNLTIANNSLTLREFEAAKAKVSNLEGDMSEFIRRYSEQIASNTDLEETIDARVDVRGISHTTLKDRLDSEHKEVTAQLAQTRESNDNLISKADTYYGKYRGKYASAHFNALNDNILVISWENTTNYHLITPAFDLVKGQTYTLTFEMEKVSDIDVLDSNVIYNKSGSEVQRLSDISIGQNDNILTLTFTSNGTYQNATLGLGRYKTSQSGNAERFKVRKLRLQLGSFSITPKMNEENKQDILNKLPKNERVVVHSGGIENEYGGYGAFNSGVFFKNKEYHCYRIADSHVDMTTTDNGFGRIMFLIRHEDGSFEKKLLDLPKDLAYRDPSLGLTPDGKYMVLKVCANTGQDMFLPGGDQTTVKYQICYWVLNENLNGITTGGWPANLEVTRHILWDGRTDAGTNNTQYHAYGSVVFNPAGHMLTTAYNGYANYGVDVLKSENNNYLNPGKLSKTDTLFESGSTANETTIFYWKNKLFSVTRMGGTSNPGYTLIKYTKDLYDGIGWSEGYNIGSYLFSPVVTGGYQTGERVIIAGTQRRTDLDTRKPAFHVLTLNRNGIPRPSFVSVIDEETGSGGYPSLVKTKNGFSTIYYEDTSFGTNIFYKEFDIDLSHFEHFEVIPYTDQTETNPDSGIIVNYTQLSNDIYEIYGQCTFANVSNSTFTRVIKLPFAINSLNKMSNVSTNSKSFTSNVNYKTAREMEMHIMRLDAGDSTPKTVVTEFRILAKRIL